MQTMTTERDLVLGLKHARDKKEELTYALKAANAEVNKLENQLIEALQASGATSTAKYDGVGSFTMLKPRVYASFNKEFETEMFEFLRSEGRQDLIKPSIHPKSLSAFVSEKLEKNESLPEFVTHYNAQTLRFNPKGA